MNFDDLKVLATSKVARQVLLTKKHSPKILFAAGTMGVIGTVVLACRATLKTSDVLDRYDFDKKNRVEAAMLTEEAQQEDIRKLKIRAGLDIAKLYAPSVGLGVLSIGALTGSHIILDKRNSAIMAAYAGLDRAYREYRDRVRNDYGDDVDRKYAFGASDNAVEEKTSDGTTKVTLKPTVNGTFKGGSPYAVCFDEKSHRFTPEPGMNAMIVQIQQNYANDKLRLNGHIFLNEVYDSLGLPRTPAGAVVGWVYKPDDPYHTGDNYVTFSVYGGDLERADAFVNGDEPSVWLDFNVDGVIYDKI